MSELTEALDRLRRIEESIEALRREVDEKLCRLDDKPIQGWKAIAAYVGLSESWAKALGDRERFTDPIPTFKRRGKVLALPSALDAWMKRHEHQRMRGEPVSATAKRGRRMVE